MKRATMTCLTLTLLLLMLAAPAVADGPYGMEWWTVNGSGGTSSGGSYSLSGTAGSSDAGTLSGGDYSLQGSFWGGAIPCADYDFDCDGTVSVDDIAMTAGRWGCMTGNDCYQEQYDTDLDGSITIKDIMDVCSHWGG